MRTQVDAASVQVPAGIRYPASILDGRNRILAIGKASLRPKKSCAVFWAQSPSIAEKIQRKARTLLILRDTFLKIQRIEMSDEAGKQHFKISYASN